MRSTVAMTHRTLSGKYHCTITVSKQPTTEEEVKLVPTTPFHLSINALGFLQLGSWLGWLVGQTIYNMFYS